MKKDISIQGGRVTFPRDFLGAYLIYGADILNDREKEIIEARINGDTLEDIGDQMGTTKERVRQIESAVVGKMRNYLNARIVESRTNKRILENQKSDNPNIDKEELPVEYFSGELSARTINALYNNHIKDTVSLYESFTTRQLPFFRGIGTKGYEECIGLLKHLRYIP